jgi:hypothetical protein
MQSGSDVTTEVMGPSYSYADNIQGPSAMGVGSRGTISQLTTNTGAIIDYVKYMISGPALGNQYFVNTGGSCTAPDKSTQSRYNWINNISSGTEALPDALKNDLGGIASDFNGLIPGILEDTEGLNPAHLLGALAADSTPTCECYTCPVSGGTESRFLNKGLTALADPFPNASYNCKFCISLFFFLSFFFLIYSLRFLFFTVWSYAHFSF